MAIGIKPMIMMTSDIANSVFLKCLTVLSVTWYLNKPICFSITRTIKTIATALMASSIRIYGIKSIICCPSFVLAGYAHQPLGIF